MTSATPELISIYVDGEATAEQAAQVEAALAADPLARALHAELVELTDLCGLGEPEAGSEKFIEVLCDLGRTVPVEGFTALKPASSASVSHRRRNLWLAAAAAVLVAFGLTQMLYRPEVSVTEFLRQVVDANGDVLRTERLQRVSMRAGDVLSAGAGERVSCRLPGALVVLLPGGRIRLGDPRDRELFELDEGMVLCTVSERTEPRFVHAAGCEIAADQAHFGLRVREPGVRPAGAVYAATRDSEVTVAVSRGSVRLKRNGTDETVRAGSRVVLRRGAPLERSQVWQDPLYVHLMRNFRTLGREVLPGYFTTEMGVTSIPVTSWAKGPDRARVLVLTEHEEAYAAHYLVLYARAKRPTALRVTRVRPYADAPELAETVTVATATVGTDWTIVALPRKAFDANGVERLDRKIPAGRGRLTRLELRTEDKELEPELKASLWAARPPAGWSEASK